MPRDDHAHSSCIINEVANILVDPYSYELTKQFDVVDLIFEQPKLSPLKYPPFLLVGVAMTHMFTVVSNSFLWQQGIYGCPFIRLSILHSDIW